jgi:ABC-2 type transport system permease protein
MKYLRTFILALQREFNGRVNIIGWFIVGTIPTIVLVLVWFAIIGDQGNLNGFTKGDFIVYYLAMTMSWYIVGGNFGRSVGNRIKNGTLNTTLLKPYNIVLGNGIEEQAWKVLSLIFAIPASFTVIILFSNMVNISFSLPQMIFLIVSLILGGINFALLEALIGISAFWVTEIWPIANVSDILQSLFGGKYIPLPLMPASLLWLTNILPFKYLFYVPVSILLSKNTQPVLDIGIQLFYALLLFTIYKFVWKLGIKKYEGVGI